MQEISRSHSAQKKCRKQHDITPHLGRRLEDVEREMVLGTLARCGGNRTWAADILGISLRSLRQRLIQYESALVDQNDQTSLAERMDEKRLSLLEAYDPGNSLPS